MNLASFAIDKKTITWFLAFLLAAGGLFSYSGLGKLEDPSFTIKTAVVSTPYPGASPQEVEEEVTARIESAAQKLGQVYRVRSLSKECLSMVFVDMKDAYTAKDLPQIWDELRRKISDAQRELPPGCGQSVVNDDYGDVFGLYYALTGNGYTYRELEDQADFLKKELLLITGVAKVEISGIQKDSIYVEIPRARMAAMGISMRDIQSVLKAQNMVFQSGKMEAGKESLRIEPTGAFSSVEAIGDILLRGSSGTLVRLSDIATLKRTYEEPPRALMHFNGQPALGIGISNTRGGNVIVLGENVKKRLKELESQTPAGMTLSEIYIQSDTVKSSIRNFLLNLAEALAIVIGVLLIFMGIRSGLLIGAILLLTILATFIAMRIFGIDLQSISLGALIVALGMLVDNAIVVTDGILVKMQRKEEPNQSALEVVKQTQWPLLGATLIAVIAFAPIGLSPDSTGEFCNSLFQVVGISLLLSWVLAVTITPLAAVTYLGDFQSSPAVDPHGGKITRMYRALLEKCLDNRKKTMIILGALLVAAMAGFGAVDKSFFPNSTSPMFTIDFWRPQGSTIQATRDNVRTAEEFLLKQEETKAVSSYTAEGALRFILTYTPADPATNCGHLVVSAVDSEKSAVLMAKTLDFLNKTLPEVDPRIRAFSKGTGGGAKIQVRFLGSGSDALRDAAEKTLRLMRENLDAINIRTNWGERVKVIRPILDEARTRQAGLTRQDVAESLNLAYSGNSVGLYREGEKLIPIVLRLPEKERHEGESFPETQIWSPMAGRTIPLSLLTSTIDVVADDPMIYRINRKRALTVECDSLKGKPGELFNALRLPIEGLPLQPGVTLEWGGEYENSQKAQGGLMGMIPLAGVAIVVILVLLFNGFKQPGIILLTFPLSIVGLTVGLLLMNKSFDFMALLGFLSLTGMLIKNGIVLIDQIDLEVREGKEIRRAIVESSISRARPVLMAAMTTVLGMLPLYFDVLFSAMATTIMFGLTFATGLTLLVVPVLYAIFFKAKEGHTDFPPQVTLGGDD